MCFRIPELYISPKCDAGQYDRGSGMTQSCMLAATGAVASCPGESVLSCPICPVKVLRLPSLGLVSAVLFSGADTVSKSSSDLKREN